jgi:multiple sugar transport system ATP-binding protein
MDAKTIQERTLSVARSLKIDHLLQRKPAQLSGGQQQRVALGRAIIRAPQIFLMDEPLSNLDAQLRDSTRAELKILHQHIGITTVYVTHDQTEAMTLADKIVVLDRGKVQQVGTPLEVYQNPANLMVASFLGNPPMNIFSARWQGGRLWMGEQSIACCPRWDLPEQVTVGVRPEAMQWSLQPIDNSLPAEVILLEPLGSYTIVRLCLVHDPQQTLLLPLPSSQVWNWRVQTPVWLVVPEQAIYLFCPQTGERYP